MPYIRPEDRSYYDENIDELIATLYNCNQPDLKPGELNYIISKIIAGLLEHYGTSYTLLNNITGVLECVKLELYRKVAANYEDQKEAENGPVY